MDFTREPLLLLSLLGSRRGGGSLDCLSQADPLFWLKGAVRSSRKRYCPVEERFWPVRLFSSALRLGPCIWVP